MAWTTPKTWIPEDGLTSSEFNLQIRDNLLETGPAVTDSAHQLLVAAGRNSVAAHKPARDYADSTVTTTSTSPTTLGGGEPSVTFEHAGTFLVLFTARVRNLGAVNNNWAVNYGPEVVGSGGQSAQANIVRATRRSGFSGSSGGFMRFAGHVMYYGRPAGTDTVEAMYWVSDSSMEGEYAHREILVIPM